MKRSTRSWFSDLIVKPATWVVVLTLLAFGLRLWQLNDIPPGWRDDELINSLVISQKVLDGDWAVYYPDASGHEALYHILNAAMLWLFGPGILGIRLLSVILGTLTVPLTYLVGNRLFSWKVGLIAAAALTFSFWSLMYSRIGIRHISLAVFMLATFYFYLRALGLGQTSLEKTPDFRPAYRDFSLAGIFLGLGFYTYFAARGIPAILLAATLYIALFHRHQIKKRLTGLLLMFGLAAIMAVPLLVTLSQQPESEARVQELAVPLVEAQSGNFRPLLEHIVQTVSMFHNYGDEEWLYNIPLRPVFGPIGAIFFWLGVVTASWYSLKPLIRILYSIIGDSPEKITRSTPRLEIASFFLMIWWLIGISPGFISVPPASLGHTIIAQSASYILLALPIHWLGQVNIPLKNRQTTNNIRNWIPLLIGLILIIIIARRDLPDYYSNWPGRGMTRFLYRADIRELAHYLNQQEDLTDFAVSGLLAGPWDKLAMKIDLAPESPVHPRWYNPERAIIWTNSQTGFMSFVRPLEKPIFSSESYRSLSHNIAGDFDMAALRSDFEPKGEEVCFQNGLCLIESHFDKQNQALHLTWELRQELQMPVVELTSNPPPPGVYSGPRLSVFVHLLNSSGEILSSDDGLWVDPTTLLSGDRFQQVHFLAFTEHMQEHSIDFGLYDPMNGARIMTVDNQDHIKLEIN